MVGQLRRLSRWIRPQGSDHPHDAVHARHLGWIDDSPPRRCDYVCAAVVLHSREPEGVLCGEMR